MGTGNVRDVAGWIMNGRELKRTIFRYLEARGWKNRCPGEYYAWESPDRKPEDRQEYYCWHAALLIEMARQENEKPVLPEGAFEVVVGGRK